MLSCISEKKMNVHLACKTTKRIFFFFLYRSPYNAAQNLLKVQKIVGEIKIELHDLKDFEANTKYFFFFLKLCKIYLKFGIFYSTNKRIVAQFAHSSTEIQTNFIFYSLVFFLLLCSDKSIKRSCSAFMKDANAPKF